MQKGVSRVPKSARTIFPVLIRWDPRIRLRSKESIPLYQVMGEAACHDSLCVGSHRSGESAEQDV